MINRTFEENVALPEILDGTKVWVRVGEETVLGRVVGISSSNLIKHYIVECLDGFIPNETYNYKFFSVPVTEIILDESGNI